MTTTEKQNTPLPTVGESVEAEFSEPETPKDEQTTTAEVIQLKSSKRKSGKKFDSYGKPGCLEIESFQKRFLKCLSITMVFEMVIFSASLASLLYMTPWFHDCNLYNDEIYHLENAVDLQPKYSFYVDHDGNCTNEDNTAYCVDNSRSKEAKYKKIEQNITCHCTDNFDSLTLWSNYLVEHDSISKKIVAWPVRGLLSTATLLKFIITIEYFVSLVVPKLRVHPTSFVIKFCSSWLCGAFLLGSAMHIYLSDYNKMCGGLGVGFWALIFALVMSVPAMLGVLTSTGYYIHIRVLKLELKRQ